MFGMDDELRRGLHALYRQILAAWNAADAAAFGALFREDGEVIGFDGSRMAGQRVIRDELTAIFADHATGRYVGIPRDVRPLGADAGILHARSGVVPAGATEAQPDLNAVQSLVAERRNGDWRVVLYQNTPAAFHGRPQLTEELTQELTEEDRRRHG